MSHRYNRRAALKSMAAAAFAAAALPHSLKGASSEAKSWAQTIQYLNSLSRADGGYAWEDQEQSHLTPTFAVIGSLSLLDALPPGRASLAEFVRTHHPAQLKKLEQERRMFEFQQVQALAWLKADAEDLRAKIAGWKQPLPYLKQYEQHGYPIFQSEVGTFACRKLLGLPLGDLQLVFVPYLESRRRDNGSFNNTPATDGGDGHILNTWWGLRALDALGRAGEKKGATIEWLQRCQRPDGTFTYQPSPEFAGYDDVAYAWAGVRALALLGARPRNPSGCVDYIRSLLNEDGGFSDRPGWLSNPMATYYALDCLEALRALKDIPTARRKTAPAPALPSNLKVFSIQLEAHGRGSPAEAVDLARSLHLHLWGAKNAKPEWISRAQELANRSGTPVKFFISDEEYGTWVNVPGLGTYSHTSDIIAPLARNFGAPLTNSGVVTWPEFRQRRLKPLHAAGGRLIWQFGENEELVRLYLDDSVERGGYAAISTFHFGNPDFTNSEPFLQRWRGKIPYVALQDSHGNEPWWFADMTTGFRTLFLAAEPTYDAWLEALKNNWVAAVRHDIWSGEKTWIHSGSADVRAFIRQRETEWRWWDNPPITRPMVSIVPVHAADAFETGRSQTGVNVRVRCAWQNTPQGLLKQPLSELVKLSIDDRDVQPELKSVKAPRGTPLADHYYIHPVTEAGRHTAVAEVKILATGRTERRRVEWQQM